MHSTIGISCILPADLRVTLGALRLSPASLTGKWHGIGWRWASERRCRNVDVFDELCESTNGDIPQVFFCCLVRGFDPKPGIPFFFRLGPRTLFFVPPLSFCLAPLRPVFGGFRLHSHDMHDLGSQREGWFSPPPPALRPWVFARHSPRKEFCATKNTT